MRSWRFSAWFPIVWTLAAGAWLVLYRQDDATCGPEIADNCSIGVSVTAGLGRAGIVLLWSLGMLAFGLAWLTDRRLRSRARRRGHAPPGRGLQPPLRWAAALAVVLAAAIVVALPASPGPDRRQHATTPYELVDVRVVSAILHPSASGAGRRRHAARVSVHVLVDNHGPDDVTLTDPMLVSGGEKLPYDRRQFRFDRLQPGGSEDAVLRFEPRSAFTQRLVTARDVRLLIAGRSLSLTLRIGSPVRSSRRRAARSRPEPRRSSTRRARAVAPPPAPAVRRPVAPRRPALRRPAAPPPPPAARPRTRTFPPPAPRRATPPPRPRPPASERKPDAPLFDDSG